MVIIWLFHKISLHICELGFWCTFSFNIGPGLKYINIEFG